MDLLQVNGLQVLGGKFIDKSLYKGDLMKADPLLQHKMTKAFDRKFFFLLIGFSFIYFLCILFDSLANDLAAMLAKYIPALEVIKERSKSIDGLAFRYFGIGYAFVPVFVAMLLWGENVAHRFNVHSSQTGRSRLELYFLIYVLGLPALLFCIFLAIFAPFTVSSQSKLFGAQVLNLMMESAVGLYIFGTLALGCLTMAFVLLVFYMWLPFSSLINKLRRSV